MSLQRSIIEDIEKNRISTLKSGGNKIGSEGAIAISNALCSNTSLQSLHLEFNEIRLEGAKAIANALYSNTSLQSLDLYLNPIGSEGAKAIARALCSNTSLQAINLRMNQIDDEGAKAFSNVLCSNTSLQCIDLGDNEIGPEGALAIAIGLSSNTSLKSLNIQSNLLGDEGAAAIANQLCFNESLESINLGDNEIGSEGATAIANALCCNKNLQSINLELNQIGDEGAKAIACSLGLNTPLQSLNLYWNGIKSDGAKAIANALSSNINAQSIELRNNQIDDEILEQINYHLRNRTNLFVYFDLKNCSPFLSEKSTSLGYFISDQNRMLKGFLQNDNRWKLSLKIPCEIKLFLMMDEKRQIAFFEEGAKRKVETKELEIHLETHTFSLQVLLYSIMLRNIFADLEIRVGTKNFCLHTCIVHLRCPQLLGKRKIESSCEVFEEIVLFMYTNCVRWNLSLEILSGIQEVAKRLKFDDLEKFILHKIENFGNINNELADLNLARIEKIMKNLFERRNEADFELEVHGKNIKIHKCVVAIQWEFFDKILLRERSHNPPEITFETFERLLFYFYTHKLDHLNERNCHEILEIADYYGLNEHIVDYCWNKSVHCETEDKD